MIIRNENEVYFSKKTIINSSENFLEKGIPDSISFSFFSTNCICRIHNQDVTLHKNSIIVIGQENALHKEVKPKNELIYYTVKFNKRKFTILLSQLIDKYQTELNSYSNANTSQKVKSFFIFEHQADLQEIVKNLVYLNTTPTSAIKERLIELKTEEFIIASLQTNLMEFYITILGENFINDPIAYTLKIIEDAPHQNWSVIDLAKKANTSESTLYRYFKKHLNTTPNQYLWDVKLEHAKKLLRDNTDLNISQIGYKVGIQNPFYFSKIFKQHTGISPKQYREGFLLKL